MDDLEDTSIINHLDLDILAMILRTDYFFEKKLKVVFKMYFWGGVDHPLEFFTLFLRVP